MAHTASDIAAGQELSGATERFLIDDSWGDSRPFSVVHSEGADSVVIADHESGDDLAEVFHCERHTVSRTPEQALRLARLFVAAPRLLSALTGLIAVRPINHDDSDDPEARNAWRAANDAIAAAGHC